MEMETDSERNEVTEEDEDDNNTLLQNCTLSVPVQDKPQNQMQVREYQLELYEMAKTRNVIACLPTGSGKTWISLLLARHYLAECTLKNKKIVFLANMVNLVEQQFEYFRKHIAVGPDSTQVNYFVGYRDCDHWSTEKWKIELDKSDVLMFSAQIFDNILNQHITMDKVALLIFDECHHATKDHVMVSIMERYKETNQGRTLENLSPRILGLTATIVKGKPKKHIKEEIGIMEEMLCCRAVTYYKYEEVLKHSTKADISFLVYVDAESMSEVSVPALETLKKACKELESFLVEDEKVTARRKVFKENRKSIRSIMYNTRKSIVKILKNYLFSLLRIHETMGLYPARIAACLLLAQAKAKLSMEADDFTQFIFAFFHSLLSTFLINTANVKFELSDKVEKLLELLKNYCNKATGPNSLCSIVFVERILDCQVLHWILQDIIPNSPDFGLLKSNFITAIRSEPAQGEAEWIPTGMTETLRRETLEGFRKGDYNLLFSTAVLEEGLDIPSCNLVVRFDRIQEFRSYAQSMGRARHQDAKFIVFIPKSKDRSEIQHVNAFKKLSGDLAEGLIDRALHVGDDDNDNEEVVYNENVIPPFRPGGSVNSPAIHANDAIHVVNSYCQSLFGSSFGISLAAPVAWYDSTMLGFQAQVILPNLAAVKGVTTGQYMSNKVLAKKAAFLEACKRLYEAGCLDSFLKPMRKVVDPKILQFYDKIKPVQSNLPKGWASKAMPKHFRQFIEPHTSTFVYEFDIKLLFANPEEKAAVYNFKNKQWTTTIWSSLSLDMIPPFRLASNMGELLFSLKNITGCFQQTYLREGDILQFKKYHKILFSKLLKMNLHCAAQTEESGIYIVPMRKGIKNNILVYDFAHELIDAVDNALTENDISGNFKNRVPEGNRCSPESDSKFMEMGGFDDAVVVPWHNPMSLGQMYCVVGVMRDKSPLSPFDDLKKAETFAEFFKNTYQLPIVDNSQPLLRCYKLPQNINFLEKPMDKGHKLPKKAECNSSVITLVPELVRWFPMPSSLLTQSRLVPSILHRISGFLHAMELGQSISNSLDCLLPTYKRSHNWEDDDLCSNYESCTSEHKRKSGDHDVNMNDKSSVTVMPRDENTVHPLSPKVRIVEKESRKDSPNGSVSHFYPMEITMTETIKGQKKSKSNSNGVFNSRNRTLSSKLCSGALALLDNSFSWNLTEVHPRDLKRLQNANNNEVDFIKNPPVYEIVKAITLAGSQDRIDLERLEIIGDSFLKFAATLFLYANHPTAHEGELTTLRSKLVSNNNLKLHGDKLGLKEILSASFFFPTYAYLPPTYTVNEKCAEVSMKEISNCNEMQIFDNLSKDELEVMTVEQLSEFVKGAAGPQFKKKYSKRSILGNSKLREKDVADCVEALIGAYYVNGGEKAALHILEWMNIRGPDQNGEGIPLNNWQFKPPTRADTTKHPEDFVPSIHILEEFLEYKFKDRWLVVQAFTHMNYINNHVTESFQRLEFLGDAVLDFLITDHIYRNSSSAKTPGEVTDLRSALVNNVTFGSLVVRYGFQNLLCQSSHVLHKNICNFERLQVDHKHEVTGQFRLLNENEAIRAVDVEVPKVLGDIFESLCGAVYIDTGRDLGATWKIFYRLMSLEIEKFSKNCPKAPIREMSERGYGFSFLKTGSRGGNESILCQVNAKEYGIFQGYGKNKKSAKEAAAKYALRTILDQKS